MSDEPVDKFAWQKVSWFQEYDAMTPAIQAEAMARQGKPPVIPRAGTVDEMLAYMKYAQNHPEFWPQFALFVRDHIRDRENNFYSHYAGYFSSWYSRKFLPGVNSRAFYYADGLLAEHVLSPDLEINEERVRLALLKRSSVISEG